LVFAVVGTSERHGMAHLDNREENVFHLDCREENFISANSQEVTEKDAKSRDVIQGTLEMLIMKTLALEPMHGYGVALRIEQISRGVFRVNPGSLLPALSRMERAGRVKSEWRATENNRRAKYYLLTAKGHKAFASEKAQWKRQTDAISRILEA
jgi:PadR family transcriptional regulator PadR